jgi:hypothetical protein
VGRTDTDGYVIPHRYWGWLGTRRAASALLWLCAIGAGVHHYFEGRHWAKDAPDLPPERQRADGRRAHVQIDFGGQWTMARMMVLGYGRELYHRQRQRQVVREGFPVEREAEVARRYGGFPRDMWPKDLPTDELEHDADSLMSSFMGDDPKEWKAVGGAVAAPLAGGLFAPPAAVHAAAVVPPDVVKKVTAPVIGGPLYPPVHPLLYAPVGMISDPIVAHHAFQFVAIGCAYLAGLGIKMLSRGRVWWSVGSLVVLLYPGCRSAIDLGQNPTLSLALLTVGWGLAVRGRPWPGGVIWGFLAFKPVWAVTFLFVPLLMGRWRFALAMAATGAGLSLATLPFVGVQAWFDWVKVGTQANALYNVNENWVRLSRDLQGVPRRILHNFSKPEAERDTPLVNGLALALVTGVFGTTVLVYLWRAGRRAPTGLAAGFLFLGCFLSCLRFMYYDVLLSATAVAVLLADPARFAPRVFALRPEGANGLPRLGPRGWAATASFPLTMLGLLFIWENTLIGLDVRATAEVAYFARPVTGPSGETALVTPQLTGETSLAWPGDTYLLLALWLWCGVRLVRGDAKPGGRFAEVPPPDDHGPSIDLSGR